MLVPFINNAHYFRLTDLFIYLFAMNDLYNNIPDNIYRDSFLQYDSSTGEYTIKTVAVNVEYDSDRGFYYISNMDEITNNENTLIHAFNIRPNTEELNKMLAENFITREDLGITDFRMPTAAFVTYESLLEVFETNKGIYNHLVNMMEHTENNKQYSIYKKVYDMFMTKVFKLDYFILDDGTFPKTYTEYLKYRDSILYLSLCNVAKISDLEARRKEIDTYVANVIYAIEEYIDSDKYKYLFSNLPTVSADYIKKYVVKIIEVFKSYKIQLYDISSSYEFDDRYENLIRPRDYISDMLIKDRMPEYFEMEDNMSISLDTNISDKFDIGERVTIDITWGE